MKGNKTPTLCWDCARALPGNGCPWANRFKPVKGWDAEETTIKVIRSECSQNRYREERAYRVRGCPLFRRDAYKGGQVRCQKAHA